MTAKAKRAKTEPKTYGLKLTAEEIDTLMKLILNRLPASPLRSKICQASIRALNDGWRGAVKNAAAQKPESDERSANLEIFRLLERTEREFDNRWSEIPDIDDEHILVAAATGTRDFFTALVFAYEQDRDAPDKKRENADAAKAGGK
jgi:hypothetical protein